MREMLSVPDSIKNPITAQGAVIPFSQGSLARNNGTGYRYSFHPELLNGMECRYHFTRSCLAAQGTVIISAGAA
ncbi:hypothetical protein EDD64_10850 [Effusibacillus lacus]|nr:hypothetical protein EDD64_10850 [Effusibacillus lacus]